MNLRHALSPPLSLPRLLLLLLTLSVAVLLPARTARAFTDAEAYSYDLSLARQLMEGQMFDYASRQLELMLQRHPAKKETIILEQGRLAFMNGKSRQAEALIALIPPTSANYVSSRLLVADMAAARNDRESAKKAFAEYFAKMPAPASDSEADINEWRDAVNKFAGIKQREGDAAGAAAILDMLTKVESGDRSVQRENVFRKAQSMISACEEQASQRKPLDTATVKEALKLLDTLQWEVVDAITGAGMVESARAKIMLKDYDGAVQSLKSADEILTEVEKVLIEQHRVEASPLAPAHLYYGIAQVGQALAKKDKDPAAALKLMSSAFTHLKTVIVKYPKSPACGMAVIEFAKTKEILKKNFGKDLPHGYEDGMQVTDPGMDAKLQEAEPWLKTRDFTKALPLCLDAVRLGRTSPRLPYAAARTAECYLSFGKTLELQALVSHLSEAYRTDAEAADFVFRIGGMVSARAQEEKAKDAREAMLDVAMQIFSQYVNMVPTTPKAAEVAFGIAENDYRVASELIKSAKDLPAGPAADAIVAQARDRYLASLPKYQRVIDLFPSHDMAIRAYYKMGWVYDSTNNPRKAADAFLRYTQEETSPKRSDDRLKAKFQAALRLMLNDASTEAVTQFTDLLEWLKPDNTRGIDATTPDAKRIREEATGYLAWSYDFSADAWRPQIDALEARLATITIREQEATVQRQRATASQQDAAAEIGKASQEYEELEKSFTVIPGAERLKAADADETKGLTGAALDTALRRAVETKANLLVTITKQERERISGVKLELVEKRTALQQSRETLGKDRDRFTRQIAALDAETKMLQTELAKKASVSDALNSNFADAEKALNAADAESKKLTADLDEAKRLEREGKDAAERQKGTLARRQVAEALAQTDRRLRAAKDAWKAVDTLANQRLRQELKTTLEALQPRVADATSRLEDARKSLARTEKEAALADARLAATAKTLARCEAYEKLMVTKNAVDAVADPDLKKRVQEELAAHQTMTARRIELAKFVQTTASQDEAMAAKELAAAGQQTQEMEAKLAPLRAQMKEARKKAEALYRSFLQAYPNSSQVPDCLARLGAVLLEFQQFEEAAKILSDLSTRFPDTKAAKQALFALGRALLETADKDKAAANREKAAAVFEKLLIAPKDQLTANLSYLSETMLDAGFPKLAMVACAEILARAADAKHADHKLARERLYDVTLIRAATAAGQLKDPTGSLAYLERLLKDNPKTAFFFDAKLLMASARRSMAPPDIRGAVNDYDEILQYAPDDNPLLRLRTLCEEADALASTEDPADLKTAVGRYQLVVIGADVKSKDQRSWLETAIVGSARIFGQIGDTARRDEMVTKYRQLFPRGTHSDEINRLSTATKASVPVVPPAK